MRGARAGRMDVVGLLMVLLLVAAPAFGQTARVTSGGGPTIQEAQQESAFGPKARIAVSQFKDKTGKGWWTHAIGDGMSDMLSTMLFNSGRFIVLERQTLNAVIKEQDLGASGRIKRDTAAPIGEIEGAELLVTGAVTEFEQGTRGARGGLGGSGLTGVGGMVLGAIAGGYKESHLALDLRVIDTKTSRVVAATSVEGTAQDFDMGGALGGVGGGVALGGALGGWSKTPMEKALRIALNEAVSFISSRTPAEYYRPTGPRPPAPSMAAPPAPPPPPAPTMAPAAAAPGKPTVEERLTRLEELWKRQLLTEEEYRKKREEILKDL